MTVIMFKPRFAPLVADSTKVQTIRPPRKKSVRPGHILSLRKWSGLPYRSPQVILCPPRVCLAVEPVRVARDRIVVSSRTLDCEAAETFAAADGFVNFAEMVEWFDNEHGLPFDGILIRW